MATFFSPAKLNLFLRILGKRSDGYHELASLFQAVSLGDTLSFVAVPSAQSALLTVEGLSMPCDGTNLISRALELFRCRSGYDIHLAVHVVKRIPMEAGLGGGSSNAATALWAASVMSGADVPIEELQQWGAELGSDVAFFLSHGTAYCTGRGEVLSEKPPLVQKAPIFIIKPPYGCATSIVYSALDSTRLSYRDVEVSLASFWQEGSCIYFNDLEEAVCRAYPAVRDLRHELHQANFEAVVLAGSGSSFFCVGDGLLSESKELSVYRVHYLNRSPGCWYSI